MASVDNPLLVLIWAKLGLEANLKIEQWVQLGRVGVFFTTLHALKAWAACCFQDEGLNEWTPPSLPPSSMAV